MAGTSLVPTTAQACGGFFCNNVEPVVQTAERILFRVDDDGTITTVVEVQYEGPPGNFGWVVPIPHVIDADAITTVEPGFFDTLEEVTGPVFEVAVDEGGAGSAAMEGAGCGCDPGWGRGWGDEWSPPPPDTSGVEVVGEAVIGPYAVEIITAKKGENLSNWLLLNGYQIPQVAAGPMQHYIDQGAAFIGLRLQPDVPAGPIDALAFTYQGQTPSVPLILTSVACASELEIVAYVAGQGRFEPGNYVDLEFDYERVGWVSEEETDYEVWLREDVEAAGGQGWNTEFAQPLTRYPELHHANLDQMLPRDLYLTRFHTYIQPLHMTDDPWWRPSTRPDVDNHHYIWGEYHEGAAPDRGPDWGLGLLVPVMVFVRRRRR